MYEFNLVLLLLQQMCVFLVIAWLMSKTRLFIPLVQVTVRLPHKLLCYITNYATARRYVKKSSAQSAKKSWWTVT